MAGSSMTVFLKLNQITEIHHKEVLVRDVAKLYCRDGAVEERCGAVKVMDIPDSRRYRYMLNSLDVIREIEAMDPAIQVSSVGESDFIISYQPQPQPRPVWEWLKTAFVSLVCFCGAAFAIMAFNNDSSVTDIFKKLYLLVMGTESSGFTILEISYSVGLALGIVVFFNHIAKRKLTTDPTPLEVEMRLYEDSINKTLIQNHGRKESEVDVT